MLSLVQKKLGKASGLQKNFSSISTDLFGDLDDICSSYKTIWSLMVNH